MGLIRSNDGDLAKTPLADIAFHLASDGIDADENERMDAGEHEASLPYM
jgi:hypothetical protein